MKLFILAVIGIINILHILDKKPPTPTGNGKKCIYRWCSKTLDSNTKE